MIEIEQIAVLNDNYVYLVHDAATGATAAIDPAVSAPVLAALAARGWSLTHILNTHHHPDHVGGNLDLKAQTGCVIVGARTDRDRIPGIDVEVAGGDLCALGSARATVLDVPGHTRAHIAYWFRDAGALFCGDTLFALGCGRLFEGTAAQMWDSLEKLRALPGDTRIYCAHEYTQANGRFALSIEPTNDALIARMEQIDALRRGARPTVPSKLRDELATNPFLRADCAELQRAIGLEGRPAVEVFAETRKRKDRF